MPKTPTHLDLIELMFPDLSSTVEFDYGFPVMSSQVLEPLKSHILKFQSLKFQMSYSGA